MGGFTKAHGFATKCMEKEYLNGRMVALMRGIIITIKEKDMEYTNGKYKTLCKLLIFYIIIKGQKEKNT